MPSTDTTARNASADSTTRGRTTARTARRRTLRIAAAGLTAVAALSLTACGSQEDALKTAAAKPFNPAPQDDTTASVGDTSQGGDTFQGGSQGARNYGGGTGRNAAEQGAHAAVAAEKTSVGHGGNAARTGGVIRHPGTVDAGSGTRHTACDAAKIHFTVQPLARPVNHLLLTATNTSGAVCDLYEAPYLRFDEAQSPVPNLPATRPQAVVTLAPGESGYAAVMTSSADGAGRNGNKMTSLSVSLPGRDGKGSIGGSANVALPGGSAYIDDSAWVTYWQADPAAAIAW
ncbi:DUF4232 domain-containing protein [Streptomyces celluloflavus]|uniref:DUF4232 domain-containing protein n=1 Tax=Streptomyces celluloflavus TaxID=58344 RepID=UPI003664EB87